MDLLEIAAISSQMGKKDVAIKLFLLWLFDTNAKEFLNLLMARNAAFETARDDKSKWEVYQEEKPWKKIS